VRNFGSQVFWGAFNAGGGNAYTDNQGLMNRCMAKDYFEFFACQMIVYCSRVDFSVHVRLDGYGGMRKLNNKVDLPVMCPTVGRTHPGNTCRALDDEFSFVDLATEAVSQIENNSLSRIW
jgi:hypothetical protein